MSAINREIYKILFVSVISVGCAHETKIKQYNPGPCDSLVNSFPKNAREYITDGCYDLGNKRVYKIKGRCYEATRDTIEKSCCGKTIRKEYWK